MNKYFDYFRSMSVSRGLQVEEDDLIQFSEGQSNKKSPRKTSKANEQNELNRDDDEDLVRWLIYSNFWINNSFKFIYVASHTRRNS